MAARTKAVPAGGHRFGAGPEHTLGIEEELPLLDEGSLALTAGVDREAQEIGAGWAAEEISAILRDGSSADRQLRLERRAARLEDVVGALADETAEQP